MLGECLHLAPANIDLRDEPDIATLLGLVVQGVGGLQLCACRRHACTCRDGLKVDAAHGEHHDVMRVLGRELARAERLRARPVIVQGGQIEQSLRQTRAGIDEIERRDHGREAEAGHDGARADAERRQIHDLARGAHVAHKVGQERAARDRSLTARLADDLFQDSARRGCTPGRAGSLPAAITRRSASHFACSPQKRPAARTTALIVLTLAVAPGIGVSVTTTDPPGADRPLSGTSIGAGPGGAPLCPICANAGAAASRAVAVIAAHACHRLNGVNLIMAECVSD